MSCECCLQAHDSVATTVLIRVFFFLSFTADGYDRYIGGIITFHETLVDHGSELDTKYKGTPFNQLIAQRGVIPGIKTDQGTIPLLNAQEGETTTQGLDGLQKKSEDYYKKGARYPLIFWGDMESANLIMMELSGFQNGETRIKSWTRPPRSWPSLTTPKSLLGTPQLLRQLVSCRSSSPVCPLQLLKFYFIFTDHLFLNFGRGSSQRQTHHRTLPRSTFCCLFAPLFGSFPPQGRLQRTHSQSLVRRSWR
jgi:hypothetical protein